MYILRNICVLITCIYVDYICMRIFSCRRLRHSTSVLFLKGIIWWVFIIFVRTPVCKVIVIFVHVWNISYVTLNRVSYLKVLMFMVMTLSLTLLLCSILVEVLRTIYFSICACSRWSIYLQYAMWFIEVTRHSNNKSMAIVDLVETTWLVRYTWKL